MIHSIKRAWGAGYRAGLCGTNWSTNPYYGKLVNIFLAIAWGEGHHRGMLEKIFADTKYYEAQKQLDFELCYEPAANDNIYGADICNCD